MSKRLLTLEDLDLPAGKKTRLYRLLYKYGPGTGRMMVLPIDQGLEHGPRDFFVNPESLNPEFQLRLALEGGFSASPTWNAIAEKPPSSASRSWNSGLRLSGLTKKSRGPCSNPWSMGRTIIRPLPGPYLWSRR